MELAWEDFDEPFLELSPGSCPQSPAEHGSGSVLLDFY